MNQYGEEPGITIYAPASSNSSTKHSMASKKSENTGRTFPTMKPVKTVPYATSQNQ
jgi:hypothetical protein